MLPPDELSKYGIIYIKNNEKLNSVFVLACLEFV